MLTELHDPALSGQELLYMGNIKSGKNYYLVNNIILAGDGQYSWKIGESGTSVAYGYNNVYSARTGDCPYTASGDTSGKSSPSRRRFTPTRTSYRPLRRSVII